MKSTWCEHFLELAKIHNKVIYLDKFLADYLKIRKDDGVIHNFVETQQKARDQKAWHLLYDANLKQWRINQLWGQNKVRKIMVFKVAA